MSQVPPYAPAPASDVNDNDRLMAALAYFIGVLVPLIILLVDSMKVRPYQRYHALQSLGLSVAEIIFSVVLCILLTVCGVLLTVVTLGIGSILLPCLSLLFFLPIIPNIYYAIVAYTRPEYFEIPVITKFMIQQGWLTRP